MIPGKAEEIGSTVYQEAGLQKTLPDQRAAIDAAVDRRTNSTHQAIDAAAANPINMHQLFVKSGVDLVDELQKDGAPENQVPSLSSVLA